MYLEAWARRSRGGAFLSLSIDRGGGGKKLGNSWQLPLLSKRARNWCRNGCQVPDCVRSNVECENCKMRKMWSKIFASSLYAGLEECQEKQPKDIKTYKSVFVHICTWGWTGGHQGAAFLVGRQRGGCGQELEGISCHSPSEEKTDNCMCTSAIKNTTWKGTIHGHSYTI